MKTTIGIVMVLVYAVALSAMVALLMHSCTIDWPIPVPVPTYEPTPCEIEGVEVGQAFTQGEYFTCNCVVTEVLDSTFVAECYTSQTGQGTLDTFACDLGLPWNCL